MATRGKRTRWIVGTAAVLLLLLLSGALGPPSALLQLRAFYVLRKLADPNAPTWVASVVEHAYDESELTIAAPAGPMRARLYSPRDPTAPGMVVVHGVHFDGIDDPRMRAYARALAAVGVPVLTPHITALTEMRVEPGEVASIGAAVKELAGRTGDRVGVFALSFAGGLALLTAADPRYAPSVAYVFSVGGHADMARVSRFYATDRAPRPDGSESSLKAHPYGAMVLIYAHPEDFFSEKEAPIAKEALRLALHEREAEARAEAAKLSPASRAQLEALAVRWDATPELRAALLRSITLHADEMAAVSPAGKLAGLRVPVYLLHGAGDNVIPATESEWLAREIPAGQLRALLVSPAISHVETAGKPTREDEWRLVHFLARVLSAGH
ncbi:MAG: alpha/beta hydrolase [Candidatus Koribacter versatilis]|uniref:Alpha/beta hydrolase n=1 Tax=Candidatus Korobacter versatilis TaxID=658062 RepID=A0A932A7J4_9BACT|nr:alpha/beta hydrolase [Candidatus Koribacter versatilis]